MSLISPKLQVCIISKRNKTFQEYCLLAQRILSFLKLFINLYLFYLRLLAGGYNWFENLHCNWLIAHLQTCIWVYKYSKWSISVSICAYEGMVLVFQALCNLNDLYQQSDQHYLKSYSYSILIIMSNMKLSLHETQKDYNHT